MSALRAFAALVAAITFSAVIVPVSPTAGASPRSRRDGFWFAFVTDSHLGSPQGNKWMSSLAEDIRLFGLAASDRPAFIVHGGDMTEFGLRDQYALYQESLGKIGVPLRGVPGNHESKWADAGKSGFAYALGAVFSSFDHGGAHFVLLDSSVSGETYGHLEKYMLEWLKEDLARAGGRPVIIFSHHPIGYEPKRFIDNDDDFFEAIGSHDIAAVFTGHGHSTLQWKMNGVPFFMGPAAMDGRYMIVKVEADAVTILEKAVGSEPNHVASVSLRGSDSPADGPSIQVEAKVTAGARGTGVDIKATPLGFVPAGPVKYRIDAGPWSDLVAPSQDSPAICAPAVYAPAVYAPAVYAGNHDASSLPDGLHTLRIRADGPDGGVWTARAEFSLDRTNGGRNRILWTYNGRGGIQGAPALTGDIVLVGANDGYLTALRASDGKVAWRFPAGGQILGEPVVDDRSVYLGAASGLVYCLDASTGAKKWHYPAESSVVGGVVVSNGRVFVGTALGWVHCINATSGKPVWTQSLGGAIRSTPAVSGDGLFVGAWDGKVYRIGQRDGKIEWATLIDPSPYYSAATGKPLARDERVYVTSPPNPRNGNYGVTALDMVSGSVLWRSTVSAGYSDPFMRDGLLAVTTGQGSVCLLDCATGELKQTLAGGGPCLDSCAVPGPDQTFVLGTTGGQLRVIGSRADRLVQAVQFGDGFIFARVTVSGDRAFVATMDGRVYAVTLAR